MLRRVTHQRRVGIPEHDTTATGAAFPKNARSLAARSVRAYIEELLPDVLEGRFEPGRVFDRTSIEDVPDGYRAMNDREASRSSKVFEVPVTGFPSARSSARSCDMRGSGRERIEEVEDVPARPRRDVRRFGASCIPKSRATKEKKP